jgi:hypothetical protein
MGPKKQSTPEDRCDAAQIILAGLTSGQGFDPELGALHD